MNIESKVKSIMNLPDVDFRMTIKKIRSEDKKLKKTIGLTGGIKSIDSCIAFCKRIELGEVEL